MNIETEGHTHTELHGKMKAEVSVMHVQDKEHQRVHAEHQKPGEQHQTDFPSQPLAGTSLANSLILEFLPPDCERKTFFWLSHTVFNTLLWQSSKLIELRSRVLSNFHIMLCLYIDHK